MLKSKKHRSRLVKELSAREFYVSEHKQLFSGMTEMERARLDYTPPTLMTFMPDTNWGGTDYLEKLESLGQDKNIEHHINAMRWDIARVEAFEIHIPELITDLKDPRASADEVIQTSKRLYEHLKASQSESAVISGESLRVRHSASIIARRVGVTFRSSGYMPIDQKLVSGFAPGKLSVITGAPSSGKTTLALNMAKRQARKWRVGYLAWESGIEDALDIVCSSQLKIPLEKMAKLAHMLTDEEQEQIDNYITEITGDENLSFLKPPPRKLYKGNPFEVNDRVLDWIESELEKWDVDIVFWDLFEKKLPARKPEQISNAIDRVQEMIAPDRLNLHMCLMVQLLLKEVEKRKDKRPTRDALKGTAAYVEAPDLILGAYRPAIYEYGLDDNIIEVSCLKQRKGPFPWRIIHRWNGTYGRITGGREGAIIVKEESSSEYGSRV